MARCIKVLPCKLYDLSYILRTHVLKARCGGIFNPSIPIAKWKVEPELSGSLWTS